MWRFPFTSTATGISKRQRHPRGLSSEHRLFPAARSTFNICSCLDVAEVSCNAWSMSDIIKAEPAHQRAVLQEKGERLANASRGPQHCYLGIVLRKKEDKHIEEMFWWLLQQWPWGFHHAFFTFSSISQFLYQALRKLDCLSPQKVIITTASQRSLRFTGRTS